MRWGLIEAKPSLIPGNMTSRWVDYAEGPHLDKGDDEWLQFVLYHVVSDDEGVRTDEIQSIHRLSKTRNLG